MLCLPILCYFFKKPFSRQWRSKKKFKMLVINVLKKFCSSPKIENCTLFPVCELLKNDKTANVHIFVHALN
jgi:hypothetical protein